jgi:DNA-binding ferritin-like protein (Dps family)
MAESVQRLVLQGFVTPFLEQTRRNLAASFSLGRTQKLLNINPVVKADLTPWVNTAVERARQPGARYINILVGEQLRPSTGWVEQLRGVMRAWVRSPQWQTMLESWKHVAEQVLPTNWQGHAVDLDRVWDVAAEGIALVWVPRGELVQELLGLPDAAARWEMLAERGADIAADCDEVLAQVDNDHLSEYRQRLTEALAAYRDGHAAPAQALAAVVFTSLLQHAYGHRKLQKVATSHWRSSERGATSIRRFKAALLIEAAVPSVTSIGDLVPGEQWPDRFNRHLTLHQVSKRQYTEAHAVSALMLATGLLAEVQSLLERRILVVVEDNDESEVG